VTTAVTTTVGFPGQSGASGSDSSGQPESSDQTDPGPHRFDDENTRPEAGASRFRTGALRDGWDGSWRDPLQRRVDALGELLGLSRTRVDPDALSEAGELLDRIAERRRLSLDHTVVALAGATGSGKSALFNALTGLELSEVGIHRPTTQRPLACAWDPQGAAALLDRLGIAPNVRFARRSLLDGVHTRPGGSDAGFEGLILLDLPDHDSATEEHRREVDALLGLVDVVVWVVDPEKYADAVLHERYLRPLAGHADVTLVVLNQVDRLPYDAADQVMDDLRRLLDEDGLALGEHGDPGAIVLSTSALTGEGIADLRSTIGQIVADRTAADRRLAADVDRATERLRPIYVGYGTPRLTDAAREGFIARLAESVGADAVGRLAEREWSEAVTRACGVPWSRLVEGAPAPADGSPAPGAAPDGSALKTASEVGKPAAGKAIGRMDRRSDGTDGVASAVNPAVADSAAGTAYRDSAPVSSGDTDFGGREGAASTATAAEQESPEARHGAATAVVHPQTGDSDTAAAVPRSKKEAAAAGEHGVAQRAAARPIVAEAVRIVAAEAADGLPAPWARAVHDAAVRGSRGLPEALDEAVATANAYHIDRPRWWSMVGWAQWLLMVLSVVGVVGLVAVAVRAVPFSVWLPGFVFGLGAAGGPLLAWACRTGSRGPARRYGLQAERRLRDAAADCGRARVLEPVAAELLRYREVREQYGIAAGAAGPELHG
jgi:GTPase Era involved in 16S rRNA processing